jgi:hypothetical protein
MKRTKKRVLSESQKRELLLNKIRQIIREEIERSIEEANIGRSTTYGGEWYKPKKEKEILTPKRTLQKIYNYQSALLASSKMQISLTQFLKERNIIGEREVLLAITIKNYLMYLKNKTSDDRQKAILENFSSGQFANKSEEEILKLISVIDNLEDR